MPQDTPRPTNVPPTNVDYIDKNSFLPYNHDVNGFLHNQTKMIELLTKVKKHMDSLLKSK